MPTKIFKTLNRKSFSLQTRQNTCVSIGQHGICGMTWFAVQSGYSIVSTHTCMSQTYLAKYSCFGTSESTADGTSMRSTVIAIVASPLNIRRNFKTSVESVYFKHQAFILTSAFARTNVQREERKKKSVSPKLSRSIEFIWQFEIDQRHTTIFYCQFIFIGFVKRERFRISKA